MENKPDNYMHALDYIEVLEANIETLKKELRRYKLGTGYFKERKYKPNPMNKTSIPPI